MSEKSVKSLLNDFGAFESSAKYAMEYFAAGKLFLINVSKKPREVEVDTQFLDRKTGKARKGKNYFVEVLNLETGEFVELEAYSKLYLDMIAQLKVFVEAKVPLIKYGQIELLPYVRAVAPSAKSSSQSSAGQSSGK